MIAQLVRLLGGSGAGAVKSVAEVFRPNAEAGAQRDHEYRQSALAQYGAEFRQLQKRTWFDSLIDGWNRSIRPATATLFLGFLGVSMAAPNTADLIYSRLARAPDNLWIAFGIILSFYFAGRSLEKITTRGWNVTAPPAPAITTPIASAPAPEPVAAVPETGGRPLAKAVYPRAEAINLSADGEQLLGKIGGRDILHQFAAIPYGRSATTRKQPYAGIVAHHPFVPKTTSARDVVRITHTPDGKQNYFGYHFVVGRNGTIYQAAPLASKRTNHIKPPTSSKRKSEGRDLSNSNAIGISFVGASHNPGQAPTAEQSSAGLALVAALRRIYGVSLPVYGHGEIQSDKQATEGKVFAEQVARAGS